MSQSQAQHCEDDITRLIEKQKLVLEGWMLKHEEKIVTGIVRVANEHFEKQVGVRYTLDDWSTSWDVKAEWQGSVGDNNETDRFSFTIQLPAAGWSGRFHFAISYEAGGQKFWDNNKGQNYRVHDGVASNR